MNSLARIDDSVLRFICRPWWTIWAGLHWGFRKHACVLWCCTGRIPVDVAYLGLGIQSLYPIDVVIFYRELVTLMTPEKVLAEMIVKNMPLPERKHMKRFYAGKQAFEAPRDRQSIARLIDDVFRLNDLPRLRESDDSEDNRIADNRRFAEGIRMTMEMRSEDPPLDKIKVPLILISEACPQLAEAIPALESDSKEPEEIKLAGDEQDAIWEAAKTCFRECPTPGGLPAQVRRQQAIDKGITPQQRYLNAIEYDRKHKQPPRLIKRR